MILIVPKQISHDTVHTGLHGEFQGEGPLRRDPVEKRRGCCGVRGVYHNIKCGQEEGKKANTPFIKKTCYSSLHCLISKESKKKNFATYLQHKHLIIYSFIYMK